MLCITEQRVLIPIEAVVAAAAAVTICDWGKKFLHHVTAPEKFP